MRIWSFDSSVSNSDYQLSVFHCLSNNFFRPSLLVGYQWKHIVMWRIRVCGIILMDYFRVVQICARVLVFFFFCIISLLKIFYWAEVEGPLVRLYVNCFRCKCKSVCLLICISIKISFRPSNSLSKCSERWSGWNFPQFFFSWLPFSRWEFSNI